MSSEISSGAHIPADVFLDRVLIALAAADAAVLRELEDSVSTVAAPASRAEYTSKLAVFSALLGATARNLRILQRSSRRAAHLRASGLYSPALRKE
jgi:hypothetical protein